MSGVVSLQPSATLILRLESCCVSFLSFCASRRSPTKRVASFEAAIGALGICTMRSRPVWSRRRRVPQLDIERALSSSSSPSSSSPIMKSERRLIVAAATDRQNIATCARERRACLLIFADLRRSARADDSRAIAVVVATWRPRFFSSLAPLQVFRFPTFGDRGGAEKIGELRNEQRASARAQVAAVRHFRGSLVFLLASLASQLSEMFYETLRIARPQKQKAAPQLVGSIFKVLRHRVFFVVFDCSSPHSSAVELLMSSFGNARRASGARLNVRAQFLLLCDGARARAHADGARDARRWRAGDTRAFRVPPAASCGVFIACFLLRLRAS